MTKLLQLLPIRIDDCKHHAKENVTLDARFLARGACAFDEASCQALPLQTSVQRNLLDKAFGRVG